MSEGKILANHKSAEKRARQNLKRRLRNREQRSKIKTTIRKVETAISEKNADTAATHLKAAIHVLDKAVSKGIVHKNKAARKKSSLTIKVNRLASGM